MNRRMSILFLVFMAVVAFSGTSIRLQAQALDARIDAFISQYAENKDFMGSALVASDGRVVFKKGYGQANIEWGIPNTPDTKFRLGSITKQFTAMLIMQLASEGKLSVKGTISDYLEAYPKKNGSRITIEHLLSHTSGIPNYTSMPFFRTVVRNPASPEEFITFFADSALEFEPGSRYRYSNSGFFVLGAIIERIEGKTYAQVLQERILTPLGLSSTGYDLAEPIIPKRASGYEWGIDGYINAPYLDMSLPYSAGSLYSTVEDLFAWDRALAEEKLLSTRFQDEMFTPRVATPGGGSYAYGWHVGMRPLGMSQDSVFVVEHGGGINGFSTIIVRVPEEQALVVLLNNTGRAPLGAMADGILGILHGREPAPVRRSLARALTVDILELGLPQALENYEERKRDTVAYYVNENDMNALGYQYLRITRLDEAIAVFTLNVEAFPQSSNVYDSLGEAYMVAGNKELAIKNYEQSIALDPNNTNGILILKRLKGD